MSGRGFVDFFLIHTDSHTHTHTECSFISIDVLAEIFTVEDLCYNKPSLLDLHYLMLFNASFV